MNVSTVVLLISGLIVIAIVALFYYRGWSCLHKRWTRTFSPVRLGIFIFTVGLFLITLYPPLSYWAGYYLSIRSVQKVMLSMVIPPLFWASLPFHCIVSGMPQRFRRAIVKQVIRESDFKQFLRSFTHPGLAWLFFVAAFMLWHEPVFASWLVSHSAMHFVFSWVLFGVALVFWSHVSGTAARVHKLQPGWLLFIILVAVEIPNMVAGVTIAFASEPIYSYYANLRQTTDLPLVHDFLLTVVGDQRLSGFITWITGSFVYVTAIVLVLNRLFKQESGLPPILSFTHGADERTIAPGLEHRVIQNRWQNTKSNSNNI